MEASKEVYDLLARAELEHEVEQGDGLDDIDEDEDDFFDVADEDEDEPLFDDPEILHEAAD